MCECKKSRKEIESYRKDAKSDDYDHLLEVYVNMIDALNEIARCGRGGDKVKVLSIKNPWAYLIFHEGKDVENRAYPTIFRGALYIQASKRIVSFGGCLAITPWRFSFTDIIDFNARAEKLNGFIIGSVRLVDCVQNSASEWAQEGYWHWILENPFLLPEPIQINGRLGFWEAPDILLGGEK